VGRSDELLDAQKLKIEFQTQRQDVPVVILPGLGHSDMVTRPEAILAIVGAATAEDTKVEAGQGCSKPVASFFRPESSCVQPHKMTRPAINHADFCIQPPEMHDSPRQ
jgi:hypothetical protein